MYENLAMFRTATAMAQHAGNAQAQIARNIANADTPGYVAKSMVTFPETLQATGPFAMKSTRLGHLNTSPTAASARLVTTQTEPSPNGNTVSLEDELLSSVQAGSAHKRALAIYSHTMTILRSSLGR